MQNADCGIGRSNEAGTPSSGIAHSEFNNSSTALNHFLQIWLVPSRKDLPPDYPQGSFARAPMGALTLVSSPAGGGDSTSINQDVNRFIGKLGPNGKFSHVMRQQRHARIQLIEGDLDLDRKVLSVGDGASVDNERGIGLVSAKGAHFLRFALN